MEVDHRRGRRCGADDDRRGESERAAKRDCAEGGDFG
jgi:hypothetical protein